MYAYLIVLSISPLDVGRTYHNLPLHCTLVHWFWLTLPVEQLAQQLKQLSGSGPVLLEAQNEHIFTGKTRQGKTIPVTVNGIKLTHALHRLHDRTCDILESYDVQYTEPKYVRTGFHPHVTHQEEGQMLPGDQHKSAKLYLVQADSPEYGYDRTVRAEIFLA